MKVKVLFTGKTTDPWIRQGVEVYAGRIRHYVPFELIELRDDSQILKSVRNSDHLVLLDEHGETFSSLDWARNLEQKTAHLPKDLVFVIGGPYGFPAEVRARCDESLSLSRMTFSHQLVRLVFLEQLYRAFTIIKGEPYHHE
ncbi:MAG: 23S rRNA (pseudouridine(1915)-N(3))-methyltransferase RlmH [Bacteroidales bacterium]|nr:23S rRNA (pseudouridine(1915)-N(3))-methyltransferase RlmH [Bacteroidales bacterium]